MTAEPLLAGIRVVDLAGEPAAMAGRILADLGAEVILVEPRAGDPLRALPHRCVGMGRRQGDASPSTGPTTRASTSCSPTADVVIDTPGFPGTSTSTRHARPTRSGSASRRSAPTGPRAGWRASDLGVMAASGNMYCTGDPDRRAGAVHRALGLRARRAPRPRSPRSPGSRAAPRSGSTSRCRKSCSSRTWSAPPRSRRPASRARARRQHRPDPRDLADARRLRLVRPARRQGARPEPRDAHPARRGDGSTPMRSPSATGPTFSPEHRDRRRAPSDRSRRRRVLRPPHDAGALRHRVRDESHARPDQLAARDLRSRAARGARLLRPARRRRALPAPFVDRPIRRRRGRAAAPDRRRPTVGTGPRSDRTGARPGATRRTAAAWDGMNIIEFGSGAAGPIATRYFAEHGATVLRIESQDPARLPAGVRARPRTTRTASRARRCSTASTSASATSRSTSSTRRRSRSCKRLVVEWADAVAENFAPRAMKGFGLDYDTLARDQARPRDGERVPQRPDRPAQGLPRLRRPGLRARAATTALTGWPDREPVGPYGTITDSLAPRFVATALAAGLLYRRRTGTGVYLDVAQVEAAHLLAVARGCSTTSRRHDRLRDGNRSPRAVPHGVFPCADEGELSDRWVAIACWTDDEWARLTEIGSRDPRLATLDARLARIDEVEAAVAAWTATRTRLEVAERCRRPGSRRCRSTTSATSTTIRRSRTATLRAAHAPGMGRRPLRAQRLPGLGLSPSGYDRAGPTLGQDNDWVLGELLGCLRPRSETPRGRRRARLALVGGGSRPRRGRAALHRAFRDAR